MLKIAFDKKYVLPLPEGHRFPMLKYELIPDQLLYEGLVSEDQFFSPKKIKEKWVEKAHDRIYIQNLKSLSLTKSEIRKTGFPLTKELVEREFMITEGSRQCVDYALEFGAAANIAGGTHHAFRDKGEGFCLFNDVAVASYYALEKFKMDQILVIDLDVHQGNGTASIFGKENRVYTFSMHGKKNYPFKKEKSDLDIELDDGVKDDEYLKTLEQTVKKLDAKLNPNLIFYISGVDILSTDKLGRLKVSREGCKKRDEMVFEFAQKNNVPIVTSMGGGYSEKIYDIVEAHCNTYKCMLQLTD
ncbi:MAG: histone deacetylase [Bacteroidota bacterium]|nr:histone deacetylase [Bacteroidota bacterium]